jgi:hypothetical protein
VGVEFQRFEVRAREVWEEIPDHFKEGIDGLVVSREAPSHPDYPEVFTMGECVTEAWPSEWQGPETLRSAVVLYFGSFEGSARLDPGFDWEAELWETLTHELRHHLESLAGADGLEDLDEAVDESFHRAAGEPFDPAYYQKGDDLGGGVFRIEDQFFLEVQWAPRDLEGVTGPEFQWQGVTYRIPWPEDLGDVHFIWIEGVDAGPGGLEVVLVRRRSWMELLRAVFRGPYLDIYQSEAVASPVDSRGP